MRFKKWNIGTPAERDVALLRSAGYPYLLSAVLAARGITSAEAAAEALERDRSLSISPMLMRDMDRAVARIQQAISRGETIAVFGDYDVDGITSTVLLMDYLRSCGAKCLRHIPRRIEEGYGLSKDTIQSLRDQGATLMITVDCGITAAREVEFARELGIDVVITDHHECKQAIPEAAAVVDPHRPDCPYPFNGLAGVGVALKLALALAAVIIVVAELFAPQFAMIFTPDPEGQRWAVINLRIEIICQLFYAAMFAYNTLATGSGHTMFVMWNSFLNCIVVRLILAVILAWRLYACLVNALSGCSDLFFYAFMNVLVVILPFVVLIILFMGYLDKFSG